MVKVMGFALLGLAIFMGIIDREEGSIYSDIVNSWEYILSMALCVVVGAVLLEAGDNDE